jgi:hypothetical protein
MADGNDLWLTTDVTQRRTANPSCDDDSDGLFDEDPQRTSVTAAMNVYRNDIRRRLGCCSRGTTFWPVVGVTI